MARRDRRGPDVLLASASQVNLKLERPGKLSDTAQRIGQALPWQAQAWQFYDTLEEAFFPSLWFGNNLAKVKWPLTYGPGRDAPVKEDGTLMPGLSSKLLNAAMELMDRLVGETGTQTAWSRSLAEMLTVVAEGWLTGYAVDEDGKPVVEDDSTAVGEVWEAVSPTNLTRREAGDGIEIQVIRSSTGQKLTLPPDATLIRIWRPHPRYPADPMGPMKVLLDDCELITTYSQALRNAALSRVPAGLLVLNVDVLPAELKRLPPQNDGDDPPPHPLMAKLASGLNEPIIDPTSLGAFVPTVLGVEMRDPTASVQNAIVHVDLSRSLSADEVARYDAAVKRVATGLDMPPEILLGTADLNHWSKWAIDEDGFSDHLEPMCLTIGDGLTTGYLWPGLRAQQFPPEAYRLLRVGYDPIDLVRHPNRAQDANDGYDRATISGKAWRRDHGYSEEDAPTPKELEDRKNLGTIGKAGSPAAGAENVKPGTPGSDTSARSRLAIVRASSRQVQQFSLKSADLELAHLRDTVMVCDRAVDEALRKAGTRLRSRAQRHAALAAQLKGLDPKDIPRRLGRRMVVQLASGGDGSDDGDEGLDGLLAGAFVVALASYRDITAATLATWRQLLAKLTGRDVADWEIAQQASDAEASAGVLETGLRQLVQARLLDPLAHALGEGERPAGVNIPVYLARRASARAGGNAASGGVTGLGSWDGGITSGQTARDVASNAGLTENGVTWVYGSAARAHPFEPHVELDGESFIGPDDPELDGSELGGSYYPGDHAGCMCTWSLQWEMQDASEDAA